MYQEAAFDSRIHTFSTYQSVGFKPSFAQRKIRSSRFYSDPEKVKDFTCLSSTSELKCLRDGTLNDKALNLHEKFYGFGICDTVNLAGCFLYLIWFMVFGAMLGSFIFLGTSLWKGNGFSLEESVAIVATLVVYKLWGYIHGAIDERRFRVYPDPDDAHFNRSSGLLVLKLKGEKVEIPFNELDVYYYTTPTRSGNLSFTLYLAHRYSNHGYGLDGGMHMYRMAAKLAWLIRFMDISKTLPDSPFLSIVRHKDETTFFVEGPCH